MDTKQLYGSQGLQLASFVLDMHRNQVERYEDADGKVSVSVKLAQGSPRTEAEVIAWYWETVGTVVFPVDETQQRAAGY